MGLNKVQKARSSITTSPSLMILDVDGTFSAGSAVILTGLSLAILFTIVVMKKKSNKHLRDIDNIATGQTPLHYIDNSGTEGETSIDTDDDDDPFTRSGRPKLFSSTTDKMVAPCRDCSHSNCICGKEKRRSPKQKRTSLHTS